MATQIIGGPRLWSSTRDSQGYRDYKLRWLIEGDPGGAGTPGDGPNTVRNTVGLPNVGAMWNFGNDLDSWAFCHPDDDVQPAPGNKDGHKVKYWIYDQLFSSRPLTTCQDPPIDDPLLQPAIITGGFSPYTREFTRDYFGRPIKSSSHEVPRGQQIEFDDGRHYVKISHNVADLQLALVSDIIKNTPLNDAPLWGAPARCVKLSNWSWERKVNGTCGFYYTRNFEFDVDLNTWDRRILDEGSKVLHGHWDITTAGLGTGCTVNITASTESVLLPSGYLSYIGAITSVTLGNGGSGYPDSTTTQLKVVQSGGKSGTINATTNATGVVTSVTVGSPGQGYASASGLATSSTSTWILDKINGAPPNKLNPQHFQRYKDRKGENARTLLDGGGCPIASTDPNDQSFIFVQAYGEGNLLLLGIPTTL